MYINLRCGVCEQVLPTSYDDLFLIWKSGYDQMPLDKREEARVSAEVVCDCGHHERFDTPMFHYTFGIMFHEMLSLQD